MQSYLLLKILLVFSYKPLEGALEEIARDYHPNWMTAIKMIDDDNYIGAENSENIFMCTRVSPLVMGHLWTFRDN